MIITKRYIRSRNPTRKLYYAVMPYKKLSRVLRRRFTTATLARSWSYMVEFRYARLTAVEVS